MWSTSPAERTVIVPPFVVHDVGSGGDVVETPWADPTVVPTVLDWPPQPAARRARPIAARAAIENDFMVPPFGRRCLRAVMRSPPSSGRAHRGSRRRAGEKRGR